MKSVTTKGVAFVFAIRHDVYWTTHFSKCISCLLHTMFYTRADQADKGDTREWSTHTMNKGNNEQRGHLSLCSYLWPILSVGALCPT
jgi:hypothetical protein